MRGKNFQEDTERNAYIQHFFLSLKMSPMNFMGNWRECAELNYFVPLLIAVVQLLKKKKKSPQKRSFFKVKFKLCFGETSVGTRCTDCVQAHVASLAA